MRLVMVKGFSKTGKTTTVEAIVAELRRRGYSVGTVKDIHYEGFTVDEPGKDTYKHRQAGAYRVTARGPKDTSIMVDEQMGIDAILKYYKEDFVVLEGDCGIKCPTIITGKTEDDISKRMCAEAFAISGVISQGRKQEPEQQDNKTGYNGLPIINATTEVSELVDLIEKKTEDAVKDFDVELTIDGEDIWMVPFVKETIKNVVVGAVKALDGYEEGKEIVIRVK